MVHVAWKVFAVLFILLSIATIAHNGFGALERNSLFRTMQFEVVGKTRVLTHQSQDSIYYLNLREFREGDQVFCHNTDPYPMEEMLAVEVEVGVFEMTREGDYVHVQLNKSGVVRSICKTPRPQEE